MTQPTSRDGYAGQWSPQDSASDFNADIFAIQQVLGTVRTCIPVKVQKVEGGGVAPVGFIDAVPMVNMLDGAGNSYPHGTVFKLPFFRLQGGSNAVIVDPRPGDIGLAVVADRDISAVKAARATANPGSLRRFSLADGIYIGGILNGAPTQWVHFSDEGIHIFSPAEVRITAPSILMEAETVVIEASDSTTVTTPTFTVNGNTVLNGSISQGSGGSGGAVNLIGPVDVTNDVQASGISLNSHTHGGVEPGGGSTGGPNP